MTVPRQGFHLLKWQRPNVLLRPPRSLHYFAQAPYTFWSNTCWKILLLTHHGKRFDTTPTLAITASLSLSVSQSHT